MNKLILLFLIFCIGNDVVHADVAKEQPIWVINEDLRIYQLPAFEIVKNAKENGSKCYLDEENRAIKMDETSLLQSVRYHYKRAKDSKIKVLEKDCGTKSIFSIKIDLDKRLVSGLTLC